MRKSGVNVNVEVIDDGCNANAVRMRKLFEGV